MTALLLLFSLGVLVGCNPQDDEHRRPTYRRLPWVNLPNYDDIKDYLSQYLDNSKGILCIAFRFRIQFVVAFGRDWSLIRARRLRIGTYSTIEQSSRRRHGKRHVPDRRLAICTLPRTTFRIIDADTLDVVFTYEIASGYLHGIFLDGDKVVLIALRILDQRAIGRYWTRLFLLELLQIQHESGCLRHCRQKRCHH
ncbi:MAG: hypothetical protein MZU79_02615 [Anaerotruncus sp.]|nr:hypothetical protein [Anaerotruncus sp.]